MSIKPIELTEKHKEMLLEMCNELFPECGFEWFANELRFLDHPKDKYLTFIHWFEFCLMHVVPKLLKSHLDKEEFYLYINDSNPIEYLYKYFKN